MHRSSPTIAAVALLLAAFSAAASAQTISALAPDTLRRGETTEVIVRGTGLANVEGATVGDGTTVSAFAATNTLLRFDVGVSATAALGTRNVVLQNGPDPGEIEVVPGDIEVFTITPRQAQRGQSISVAVRGSNLDTIAEWDFGAGIDITEFNAGTATTGTFTLSVDDTAFAGPRAFTARRADDETTVFGGFEVLGGTPVVSDAQPNALPRETDTLVALTGDNLDAVDSVSAGARVQVLNFQVSTPNEAYALLRPLADATAGPRDLTLRHGEASTIVDDAVTITRGDIALTAVRPDRLHQQDVTFITLEGSNLDGATDIDLGDGVTVTAIQASLATSITADVTVAEDAEPGFRDLTITGPAGTTTLRDAVVVAPYVPPAVDLRFDDELEVGDTQVGTIGVVGVEIENAGALPESITLLPADGETALYRVRRDDGPISQRITTTLDAGETALFVFEFTPDFRGRFGVAYEVRARDGEVIGEIVVRGSGIDGTLYWSLPTPSDFGVFDDGETAQLPRLDTLIDGVDPPTITLGEVSVRSGDEGALPEDMVTFSLASTRADGAFTWGATEITWSATAPEGTYLIDLITETDDPTADFVPFQFLITFGERDGDVGLDVGRDTGFDTGDTATVDVGRDTPPDVRRDTSLPDTSTPDVDAPMDAREDDATDGGVIRTGGGGGCAAGMGVNGTLWWLTVLGVRRRRRLR